MQASHLWLALERITKHDSESNFVSWRLAPTRLWPHNVLLSNGNWVVLFFSASCLPPILLQSSAPVTSMCRGGRLLTLTFPKVFVNISQCLDVKHLGHQHHNGFKFVFFFFFELVNIEHITMSGWENARWE